MTVNRLAAGPTFKQAHVVRIGIFGVAAILSTVHPAGAQDAEAGKAAFARCQACHSAETTENRLGPHLVGVVDRDAGTVEDFVYSDALMAAAADGLVWDAANLAEFLADPASFLPGTKMVFPGISDETQVADLIAYLDSTAP